MPDIDDLPLQQLGCTMLHNTYDRADFQDPVTHRILLDKVYDSGIRGIELDLVKQPGAWDWSVSHGDTWNPAFRLIDYLTDLAAWQQQAGPQHEPIIVYLDPKGSQGTSQDFPGLLDATLTQGLQGVPIWSPLDLLVWPGDLMQTLMAQGWPLFGDLRGHLILVLSGQDNNIKKAYYQGNRSRLCFSDIAGWSQFDTATGDRVVLNGDWNQAKYNMAQRTGWALTRRAVLTRVYNVNTSTAWRATAGRVNIVATDDATLAQGQGWLPLPAHPGGL